MAIRPLLCVALFVFFLGFIASSEQKHTVFVDFVYPATEDTVTIRRMNADDLAVKVLDVRTLKINSPDGLSLDTPADINLKGSNVDVNADDHITLAGGAVSLTSEILNTQSNDLDFTADDYSASVSDYLEFIARDDLNLQTDDIHFAADNSARFTSAQGDFVIDALDTISLTGSTATISGTSGLTITSFAETTMRAKQGIDIDTTYIGLYTNDDLNVSTVRNDILLHAAQDFTVEAEEDLNVSGSEGIFVQSKQGDVSLSAQDTLSVTGQTLLAAAHTEVDVYGSNSVQFSADAGIDFIGGSGVTVQSKNNGISVGARNINADASRLVIDQAGFVTFTGKNAININAADSTEVASENTLTLKAVNTLTNAATHDATFEAGSDIQIGKTSTLGTSSSPINFNAGKIFTLAGSRSTAITASSSFKTTNTVSARMKNDGNRYNEIIFQGDSATISATQNLNVNGGDMTLQATNTFTVGNAALTRLVIGALTTTGTYPRTASLNGASVTITTAAGPLDIHGGAIALTARSGQFAISPATFSVNSGLFPHTTSLSSNNQLTATANSGDITFKSSNFNTYSESLTQTTKQFTLATAQATFPTHGDVTWTIGNNINMNWNGDLILKSTEDVSINANDDLKIGTSKNENVVYKGNWLFSSSVDMNIRYNFLYWESPNFQDITLSTGTLSISATTEFDVNARRASYSYTNSITETYSDLIRYESTHDNNIEISTATFSYTAGVISVADFQSLYLHSDAQLNLRLTAPNTISLTSIDGFTYSVERDFTVSSTSVSVTSYDALNIDVAGSFTHTGTQTDVLAHTSLYVGGSTVKYAIGAGGTVVDTAIGNIGFFAENVASYTASAGNAKFDAASNFYVYGNNWKNNAGVDITNNGPTMSLYTRDSLTNQGAKSVLSVTNTASFSGGRTSFIADNGPITLTTTAADFIANVQSTTATANSLLFTIGDNWNVYGNDDVSFSAGTFSYTASGQDTNVPARSMFFYANAQDADITFSSGVDTTFTTSDHLFLNAGDISNHGAPARFVARGQLTVNADSTNAAYTDYLLLEGDGTSYVKELGMNVGLSFRSESAGDFSISSVGNNVVFHAHSDLSVTSENAAQFTASGSVSIVGGGRETVTTSGFTFDASRDLIVDTSAQAGPIHIGSIGQQAGSLGALSFVASSAGRAITVATEKGDITLRQGVTGWGVTANSLDLNAGQDMTTTISGTGNLVYSATNSMTMDATTGIKTTLGQTGHSGTLEIFGVSAASIRSSDTNDVVISSAGTLTETIVGDHNIVAGGDVLFTMTGDLTAQSVFNDINWSSKGSARFAASGALGISSNDNQLYQAGDSLYADGTLFSVLTALVQINAGGDVLRNGFNAQIATTSSTTAATSSIKYTSDSYVQRADTTSSFSTDGYLTIESLGTNGIGRDVYIQAADLIALSAADQIDVANPLLWDVTAKKDATFVGNQVSLSAARTMYIDVERQLQVTATLWDTLANKIAVNSFGDISVTTTGNIVYDSDAQQTWEANDVFLFDESGTGKAINIKTNKQTSGIVVTTLKETSDIIMSSSTNVAINSNNKLTMDVDKGLTFAAAATSFNIANTATFNARGTLSVTAGSMDIQAKSGDEQWTSDGNMSFSTGQGFTINFDQGSIEPDLNFVQTTKFNQALTANTDSHFTSGLDTTINGTNSVTLTSNSEAVDFIVRGQSDKGFGSRWSADDTLTISANYIEQTGARGISFSAADFAFTGADVLLDAAGPSGIKVSTTQLFNQNLVVKADVAAVTAHAQDGINILASGVFPNSGYIFSTAQSSNPSNGYSSLISAANSGLWATAKEASFLLEGQTVQVSTTTTGSVSMTSGGRNDKGIGIEIDGAGYGFFLTSQGSASFVGSDVSFFTDRRQIDNTLTERVNLQSQLFNHNGFQAIDIVMSGLGVNSEGNGVQIRNSDPLSDLLLEAQQGQVVFHAGRFCTVDAGNAVTIHSFDDQLHRSRDRIRIAGEGRTFIDDQFASIYLATITNSPSLGSNIEFDTHTDMFVHSVGSIVNNAVNLLDFANGAQGTMTFSAANDIVIYAPDNNLVYNVNNFNTLSGGNSDFNFDGNGVLTSNGLTTWTSPQGTVIVDAVNTFNVNTPAIFFDGIVNVGSNIAEFEVAADAHLIIPYVANAALVCSGPGEFKHVTILGVTYLFFCDETSNPRRVTML